MWCFPKLHDACLWFSDTNQVSNDWTQFWHWLPELVWHHRLRIQSHKTASQFRCQPQVCTSGTSDQLAINWPLPQLPHQVPFFTRMAHRTQGRNSLYIPVYCVIEDTDESPDKRNTGWGPWGQSSHLCGVGCAVLPPRGGASQPATSPNPPVRDVYEGLTA